LVLPYKMPIYLGSECSGVVHETGKAVKNFKVGDHVFLRKDKSNNSGTLAEYFVEEEEFVAHAPKSITLEESAAFPLVGLTTYQALIERGQVQKGQKVFINAGPGGVGSFANQLAKNVLGAEVYTTASEKKVELCKTLGADHVIDYKKEKFEDTLKDIDFAFDTAGEASSCFKIVKADTGKVITISGIPSSKDIEEIRKDMKMSWFVPLLLDTVTWKTRHAANKKHIDYCYLLMHASGKQLEEIASWIDQKKIVPVIDKVFDGIDKTAEALSYLEAGHATGKVIVKISAPSNPDPKESKEES